MSEKTVSRLQPLWQIKNFLLPYTKRLIVYAVAMFGAAGANLALPQGIRYFIDNAMHTQMQLVETTAIVIGIGILLMTFTTLRYYVITWVGERVIADIRDAVFARVITLSTPFFELRRTGEIISRLTSDVATLQVVLTSSASIALRSIVMMIGAIILMFLTNLKLSIFALIAVPIVVATVMSMGRLVKRLSEQFQDSVADVGSLVEESLNAIRTVQAYNLQQSIQQRFHAAVEDSFAKAQRRVKIRTLTLLIAGIASYSAVSLVIWIGGSDVVQGELSAGELTAFMIYTVIAAVSIGSLSEIWGNLQQAAGATARLFELLNEQPEIDSIDHPTPLPHKGGQIEFSAVSFAYPTRPDILILKALNLRIQPGETLALVGLSGSGKSTLMNLLLRYYDPLEGEIRFNGVPLKELSLHSLRSALAIVPQDPTIFSEPILENIAIGNPEATEEQIMEAAMAANAHEFIMQLPHGYHSHVGEKGIALSGGQRQRIAIARALLRNPEVLLLDEATSALDAENERLVQEALNRLTHNRTTLVIAHRLATVKNADRIAVIGDGEVQEIGTHEELIQKNGTYAHLAALQFHDQFAVTTSNTVVNLSPDASGQ